VEDVVKAAKASRYEL